MAVVSLLGFIALLWGSHLDLTERFVQPTNVGPWGPWVLWGLGGVAFFLGALCSAVLRLKEIKSLAQKAIFGLQIFGIGAFFIFSGSLLKMSFLTIAGFALV